MLKGRTSLDVLHRVYLVRFFFLSVWSVGLGGFTVTGGLVCVFSSVFSSSPEWRHISLLKTKASSVLVHKTDSEAGLHVMSQNKLHLFEPVTSDMQMIRGRRVLELLYISVIFTSSAKRKPVIIQQLKYVNSLTRRALAGLNMVCSCSAPACPCFFGVM